MHGLPNLQLQGIRNIISRDVPVDLLEERLIELQEQNKLQEYCTAVKRMSIIISESTKCYSVDQSGVRTGQLPYSNKILFAEFDKVTSFIHEVAHELDEKLAWEEMKKFLRKLLTRLAGFNIDVLLKLLL